MDAHSRNRRKNEEGKLAGVAASWCTVPLLLFVALMQASCTGNTSIPECFSPTAKSVSPNQVQAGVPTLTIRVHTDGLEGLDGVSWEQNGTTTFLPGTIGFSSGATDAVVIVPASLLLTPGIVHITVQTTCQGSAGIPQHGKSNTVNLTINPNTISVVSGSGQSTAANTAFGAPLKAKVTDGGGNAVPSLTVTFTAPTGGATAVFAGGVNTAVTDATGVATSTQFTANGVSGSYSVNASVAGAVTPAVFSLMNTGGTTPPLSISPGTLPVGTVTKAYVPTAGTTDTTLKAIGGAPPYKSWTLVNNPPGSTPPTGLTIDPNTGVISGTPTTVGTFTFTSQVTDSSTPAQTASNSFSITVGSLVPHITTISPTTAIVNDPAFTTLTVNGTDFVSGAVVKFGNASLVTTFVGATQLTAAITAADKANTGTIAVQVVNPISVGGSASPETVNFTLTSPSALTIIVSVLSDGTLGASYLETVHATGGVPPYTWSAVGLPPALGILTNPDNTGSITGTTITRAGEFPLLVTVKDAVGGSDAKPFTLRVPCIYHTTPGQPANENASLAGPFVFRFSGFDASGRTVERVGGFFADGNVSPTTNNAFGSLTAGHQDVAGVVAGAATFKDEDLSLASPAALASTYCIGNIQGRLEGTLTMRTATSTVNYAITVSPGGGVFGGATTASIIEFDPVDKVRGTGMLAQQAPSLIIQPGNYVFGMKGRDSVNGPASAAGVFNLDATLKGTTGEDDFNDPAVSTIAVNNNPIAVTFSGQPDANGRTTGTLTAGANTTPTGEIDFVAYAVHPYELFVLSHGSGALPATSIPILSGEIFRQIPAQPLDARNLNGSSIFYLASANPSSPSSGQSYAAAGVIVLNGNANTPGTNGLITNLEFDFDNAGTISAAGTPPAPAPVTTTTGTYTVAADGRAVLTPNTPASVNLAPIAYLTDRNAGVLLDPTPGAGLGRLFPHLFVLSSQPAFGITNTLPSFVDSTVTTGFTTVQTAATSTTPGTLNSNQDVDSPSLGIAFDVKGLAIPFTQMDALNARFQVGTCGALPNEICLIGYGTYGSLFATGAVLLDETHSTATPGILFSGSLPINPAPAAPVFITPTSTTFKEGAFGSFAPGASGFPTPTLSQTAGVLPSGVTFASGRLSGTPAAGTAGAGPGPGGSYPVTFHAANGFPPDASQSFTLNVNASSATLAISTTFLPGGTVGAAYAASVLTSGGSAPFSWLETTATPLFDPVTGAATANSGACAGLKLDLSSASATLPITGTPTTKGVCGPFTLQIQDSSAPKQTANSVSLAIAVN